MANQWDWLARFWLRQHWHQVIIVIGATSICSVLLWRSELCRLWRLLRKFGVSKQEARQTLTVDITAQSMSGPSHGTFGMVLWTMFEGARAVVKLYNVYHDGITFAKRDSTTGSGAESTVSASGGLSSGLQGGTHGGQLAPVASGPPPQVAIGAAPEYARVPPPPLPLAVHHGGEAPAISLPDSSKAGLGRFPGRGGQSNLKNQAAPPPPIDTTAHWPAPLPGNSYESPATGTRGASLSAHATDDRDVCVEVFSLDSEAAHTGDKFSSGSSSAKVLLEESLHDSSWQLRLELDGHWHL